MCTKCVADWTSYTECTQSCEGGSQYKEYIIEEGPEACPFANNTMSSKECNTRACPAPCILTRGNFTECIDNNVTLHLNVIFVSRNEFHKFFFSSFGN